jgi:hypothetical protein
MKLWLGGLASVTLALGACSADVAPEPAPTLDTVGAFVAVDEGEEALSLYRTLAVLGEGNSSDVLFMTRYSVAPQTYAEASALAKRRDLPASKQATLLGRDYFDRRDWRVVWFRTLSFEEQAAFR